MAPLGKHRDFPNSFTHKPSPISLKRTNLLDADMQTRLTFGRAQLAGVGAAIILVNRVQEQPAAPAVEVHLAVEQRRLDELAVREPVYIYVLGPYHVTLKQGCLASLHHDVFDRPDHSQSRLYRGCWVKQRREKE